MRRDNILMKKFPVKFGFKTNGTNLEPNLMIIKKKNRFINRYYFLNKADTPAMSKNIALKTLI